MASPQWPAPTTTTGTWARAPLLRRAQLTLTAMLVGFVRTSYTAERFCDWATSAWRSAGLASASMSYVTVMSLKPLRTPSAEDAVEVHRGLHGRAHRAELDLTLLRDGGDARREAAAQRDQDELRRGHAVVLGGELEGVVGVVVKVVLCCCSSPKP